MKFAIFALVANISAIRLDMNLSEMTNEANSVLMQFNKRPLALA